MDSLMLVASVFGPYLFIMGLWMLLHRKNCMKICDAVRKSPPAIYVMGWTSVLLGFFIIYQYNMWNLNIALFVTVLGWAYLARGLIILFVPQLFLKTEAKESSWVMAGGILRLIWGIVLCAIAF